MRKLILVTLFMVAFFSSEAQNKCKITGTLTNRPPNSVIYLADAEHDPRLETIEIQAKDGKFEFEFEFDEIRKYELVFKDDARSGSFYPIPFFPKKGTISFELYSADEFEKTVIKGDPEQPNKDKFEKYVVTPFEIQMDSLEKVKEYNEKGEALIKRFELERETNGRISDSLSDEFTKGHNDNSIYTKEFLAAREKKSELYQKMEQAAIRYISENPSIFSYSVLINKYLYANTGQESIPFDDLFKSVYEKKYPNHVYTKLINMTIKSRALTTGGKYIDFEAPDLNGNMHKLSSLIDGKIAIIDLWASW